MRLPFFASFLVLLCSVAPAAAASRDEAGIAKALTGEYVPNASAPVQITYCGAYVFGGYNSAGAFVDRTLIREGVKFKNTSSKTATAVRFRFQFLSEFGDAYPDATQLQSIDGTYSPGVDINLMPGQPGKTQRYSFQTANTAGDDVDVMLCSVDSVKFDDGSIWHSTQLPGSAGKSVRFDPIQFFNRY